MVGVSDAIGRSVLMYLKRFGERARFRLDDDISVAIGQHRWDVAHRLNRVKLRLMRLERLGYLDEPHPAWSELASVAA